MRYERLSNLKIKLLLIDLLEQRRHVTFEPKHFEEEGVSRRHLGAVKEDKKLPV